MGENRVNENQGDTVSGVVVEAHAPLSVEQLLRACAVELAFVVELVEEGVLELQQPEPGAAQPQTVLSQAPETWYFSVDCVQRLRTARRLQRDLHINVAGVAVILDLLDQVRSLEAKLLQRARP